MKFTSFFRSLRDQGFTLVELMVVVGIVGILSAVAIPNFKKYQAKSKTTEAKLHLAAIYTAEQSFFSDYDTYAVCLTDMGYNPNPEALTRYYATGFASDETSTRAYAVTNGAACGSFGSTNGFYGAGKLIGASLALVTSVGAATTTMSETTFVSAAVGAIEKSNLGANADRWTINQSKQVRHTNTGY